jgi:hypothetical protein
LVPKVIPAKPEYIPQLYVQLFILVSHLPEFTKDGRQKSRIATNAFKGEAVLWWK